MGLDNIYRGRSLEDWIKTVVDWMHGNGKVGAAQEIHTLKKEQLTRQDVKQIVDEALEEHKGMLRKDWNSWINTALLLVTAFGVFFGPQVFGG